MKVFYGQIAVIALFVVNILISFNLCGDSDFFWGYFIICCLIEFVIFIIAYISVHKDDKPTEREIDENLRKSASEGSNSAWTELVNKYKGEQ